MTRERRAELRRLLVDARLKGELQVGRSALCRHRPRCSNLYSDGYRDVTVPCAGLSEEDARLLAASVNALEELVDDADDLEDENELQRLELEALRAELAALRP